jgi:hypothetical protein
MGSLVERARAKILRASPAAALALAVVSMCPARASADYVYTDISNWTMYYSSNSFAGQYHISSLNNSLPAYIKYRWTQDTPHSSHIFTERCTDLSYIGSDDLNAHDTNYHYVGWGVSGDCFWLGGYSLYDTWTRDGRVAR